MSTNLMPRTINSHLSPDQFASLRSLIAAYAGVYLDDGRQRLLEAAITQRIAATQLEAAAYETFLKSPQGRHELQQLVELALNHETFFFRNQPHIRALREVVLPELHRQKPITTPLRIWSAGCATGEEAYSLAICALEACPHRSIEIIGTDLSSAALDRANIGFYRGRALTHVSAEQLNRFFRPQSHGYVVRDEVRRLVRFEQYNLLEPFPPSVKPIDLIFCQNVLIYFQQETTRRILERFRDLLPEGGMLFLGFAETIWNLVQGFRTREISGAYVYVRDRGTAASRSPNPPTERVVNLQARSESRPIRVRVTNQSQPTPANTTTPTDHTPRLEHARRLIDVGEWDAALAWLAQMAPDAPDAPAALILVAQIHADRGDLDLAAMEIRRALQIDPMLEQAYTLLGTIYGRQGLWPAAVAELERARYLNTSAPLISFWLADAYRQAGKYELATREYRSTIRKLEIYPPDALIDGVAVHWLRETCHLRIHQITKYSTT